MKESNHIALKKICYIVTLPDTIEAFFIPQLQYFAEKRLDVSVICSQSDSLQDQLGANIKYIPIDIPRGISFLGMLKATCYLWQIFRKEKYDLIQYSTPNAAFCSCIAGVFAGIKIRNYHLMGFRYLGAEGFGRKILKLLEWVTCQLSTSIECVSKSNQHLGIEERLFTNEKATVIWNGSTGGVDLHRFDYSKRELWRKEIRQKFNYSNDDFVFGFVGRITRDKGVNEILEAYSQLNQGKLLLLGEPEGFETLKQNLFENAKKNPNITFYGNVMDIEKYFAAIDVLLLPSYREGFGNVVIEAAAMGTPAIVSNIPGPVDTVRENETAMVIPVKNAVALQVAMQKIQNLDNRQMGLRALEYASSHFDCTELNRMVYERKLSLLNADKQQLFF